VVVSLTGPLADESAAQSPLQRFFENVPNWSGTAQPAEQTQVTQQPQPAQPPEPVSPAPIISGTVPPVGAPSIELSQRNGLITLVARTASLSEVVSLLAQEHQLNIVAANDIDAVISITLHDVPVEEALTAILEVANYTWVRRNNIILITSLVGATNLPADTQGRQIQVFELDFSSAEVIAQAVETFLSPIGKVSTNTVTSSNNRHTRELVIVEDLPSSLARIASYIHQIDQPPRQVLLEAHVFQVNLSNINEHGVNFNALLRAAGSNITLKSAGLASSTASPAFLATVEGGDLGSVIECLLSTTDSKTLGSPKLLVLNGQEARFQVGDKIGYQGSQTTTETSTFQNVQFLEVGVVLQIVPQITRDNRVLLHIEPKVSTGEINPTTQAPEESTTELQTDVMLNDGQGMIIGGLIKETDSTVQTKIPWLGNVRGLGWFFRRSERTKERAEIIIAVLPRIQPYEPQYQAYEQGELVKAGVPLFHGPLHRTDRPWDPVLPDGRRVSVPLNPRKAIRQQRSVPPWPPESPTYIVPNQPVPQQQFIGEPFDPATHLPAASAHGPFLSDEVAPMQAVIKSSQPQGQIISDQQ
jgi:type II secretory pathway component GspD/PulD (secretin)